MESLTLVHEDIYAYIDPVEEFTIRKTGNSMEVVNDARRGVVDQGVFVITAKSGTIRKVVINDGHKNVTFVVTLNSDSVLKLDFRNNHFVAANKMIFPNDLIELRDGERNVIKVTLEGGEAEIIYTYEAAVETHDDLMFLEGLNVDTNNEIIKKTLANGKEKFIKNTKKTHSFSINGIWSQDEISKFVDNFRLRLVDEEGNALETLAHCAIESTGRSSSSGGDLTYTISGSCQKIY